MNGRGMLAVFLALTLALAAAARPARAGEQGVEFGVRAAAAWLSPANYPAIVEMRSRSQSETDVSLLLTSQWSGDVVTRKVLLPPGGSARVEMTFPSRHFTVSCTDGVETETRTVIYSFNDWEWSVQMQDRPAPLACLNSYMLRELELLPESAKPNRFLYLPLATDDLPGAWQSYAGLLSIILMDAGEAVALRPAQREAVARWVRWCGGGVWIVGENAMAAADSLGLSLAGNAGSPLPDGTGRQYAVGNGRVFVQAATSSASLVANVPTVATVNPLQPYFRLRGYGEDTPGIWLLESLVGVSTDIVIIILLLLGLIMGPINYWFISRRRNSLLFFVTTPVIAIAGALVIVVGTFLAEGMESGYNQFAVLARGAGTDEAMLFDCRGVRSGFFVATPRFSADSLVMPFARLGDRASLTTDLTGGTTLVAGWLQPRFPSGFVVARPVISRLGVSVEEEDGRWLAVNDLGFHVSTVAARLPDGGYGWVDDVPPGGRKALHMEEDESRLRGLYFRTRRLTDERPMFRGVSLIARCDGLPYLEDGNLASRLLDGEYYYMVTGSPEGVGP